jgi:hypothetical protein
MQPSQAQVVPHVQQGACEPGPARQAQQPGWCVSRQQQPAEMGEAVHTAAAGQLDSHADGSGDAPNGAAADAEPREEQPEQQGAAEHGHMEGEPGETAAAEQAGEEPRSPCAAGTGDQAQAALDPPPAAAAEAVEVGRKPGKLRQLFDYLVVYDLEATCDREKKLQPQVPALGCHLAGLGDLPWC